MLQDPITDAVLSDMISGMLCVKNQNRPKKWLHNITEHNVDNLEAHIIYYTSRITK
jgi:hypothetical protein